MRKSTKEKNVRTRRTPKVTRADSRTASKARKPRVRTVSLKGWRPIATAPKDGRDLLVTWLHTFDDGSEYCPGHFILAYFKDWYGTRKGAWVYEGDFAVRFEPDGFHYQPQLNHNGWNAPTHWMPLPMLPTARNK